jgi:hypothetical protein
MTPPAEILKHVGYEWWMMQSTRKLLNSMSFDADPVRNAVLESLLVHARALIDFFWKIPNQKPMISDWIVDNLGSNLKRDEMPSDIKDWREEVNKRIAHITDRRLDLLEDWHLDIIWSSLENKLAHVKSTLGTTFPDSWIGDGSTNSRYVSHNSVPHGPDQQSELKGGTSPTGAGSSVPR